MPVLFSAYFVIVHHPVNSPFAPTDLLVSTPSCSQAPITLDIDVLTTIFEKAASIGNIRDAIMLTGSRVTPKAATELMAFLINEMKEIKEVSLNIEDPDLTTFNLLLDQLINADNVKLKVLRIKRRKGGQTLQKVCSGILKRNIHRIDKVTVLVCKRTLNGSVPMIDFSLTSVLEYECVVFLFSNREVVIQHTFHCKEKHTIQHNSS
uniref:Alba domain-containing protein n=1 Tax=Angiostrongylus cantonensis TaxID=6313 RepID=A0A0K0DGG0_ANGCA